MVFSLFRQGLCRGQATAAGRPGSAGANGLRPFRRCGAPPGLRPSSANRRHPQARRLRRLLTVPPADPPLLRAGGTRPPPAAPCRVRGPGAARRPPGGKRAKPVSAVRSTAGAAPRPASSPGLRPACSLRRGCAPPPRLCKAARPRFLPKTGPHCVVIPYPGCRRCRAVGYPPGTPAKRRRRWRCGSSYRRSPAAVPQPRCRRRR